MDILKIEVIGDAIQVRYADGSREEIEGGIYERKDTSGDTVEERPATGTDRDRLAALADSFEAEVKPLGATVVKVETFGDDIEIRYDDGRKESVEAGIYEIKNADNKTVFERAAVPEDIARLAALEPGEFGDGTPSDSGPNDIPGTVGDDRLDGTDAADTMDGLAGADRLRGRGGNDAVNGGDGDDRVRGDDGDDTVDGGAGNDRVRGDRGNDTVSGGDGDDRARGGDGDDIVGGDAGDDRVDGQSGDDRIDGGDGSDVYNGGLGADTLVFGIDGASDRIKDFEDGQDLIDISAFGLTGTADLVMIQDGGRVMIDLGGGDTIRVDNVTLGQLTDADFIF